MSYLYIHLFSALNAVITKNRTVLDLKIIHCQMFGVDSILKSYRVHTTYMYLLCIIWNKATQSFMDKACYKTFAYLLQLLELKNKEYFFSRNISLNIPCDRVTRRRQFSRTGKIFSLHFFVEQNPEKLCINDIIKYN